MINLTILGTPIPAARPRVVKGHTYNPKQKQLEKHYWLLKAQWPRLRLPLTGPVSLEVTFFMPIPKSLPKKIQKMISGDSHPHCKKPDIDNLLKMVLDAMAGTCFGDDSQIYLIMAKKLYSEQPRTEITLEDCK